MTAEERLVATATDGSTVYQAGNDLHLHFEESLRRVRRALPAGGGVECPYPGLQAFGAGQSRWFFGRDTVTADVLVRLDQSLRDGTPLALVGPSGAGKSSLLNAGVLPALERQLLDGGRQFRCFVLTPTAHPLLVFAAATGVAAGDPDKVWAEVTADGPVAVVVDQLEELFTQCGPGERRDFVELLAAVPQGNLLVLGMRSDFYTQCTGHPWLRRVLQRNQIVLGAMREEELRQAIQLPLRGPDTGVRIEPGLVELLLRDLGTVRGPDSDDEYPAGRLPLLAHALRACWHQLHGRELTVDGYQATGGIRHAVATTAEHVYLRLDDAQRGLARTVFLRMVRIDADAEDTRRRLSRTEIAAIGNVTALTAVVDEFVDSRLLTAHDDAVEITHEVLLHAWPRLRSWIDDDREGRLTQQRLAEAATEWQAADRDPGTLYRGQRLDTATAWHARHTADLTSLEREFLAAGVELRDRERDAAAQRARRLRGLVALLAALLLVATTAGIVAADQRADALGQASVNLSRQVALESGDVREVDADLAILLGAEAVRRSPTIEARASAVSAENQHLLARLDGHRGAVTGAAFDASGHLLATAGPDDVRLWDVAGRTPIARLEQPGGASSVTFTAGGKGLVTGGSDGNVYRWDVATRTARTLAGHHGPVTALAADGRTLASASRDGTVRLWDLTTGTATGVINTGVPLNAVALSPDGRGVAAGGDGHDLRIWDVGTRRERVRLQRKPAGGRCGTVSEYAVTSLSFSPDGRTLISGDGESCLITVWDPRTGTATTTLSNHTWDINQVSFSPDGSQIASTSRDFTVRLWNAKLWSQMERRTGHTGSVLALAWAPDGRQLMTGGADQSVRLWRTPALTGHTDAVNGVGWRPDGRVLASAGRDGSTRIWDVSAGRTVQTLAGHTGAVGGAAFSPSGDLLVTAGYDGTVRFWDGHTYAPRGVLTTGRSDWAYAEFSPDGRRLATSGPDCVTLVWDVASRRVLYRITAHPAGVDRAVFSPDGRLLATAGADNRIGVFDAATGRPIRMIDGHLSPVYGIVFTPDSRQIISAGGDRYLRVWDTATGAPAGTLRGHRGLVLSLAISRDGRHLASGDVENNVMTWDRAGQTQLTSFENRHTAPVTAVAFAPDGLTLASAARDGSVRLWQTDFDATDLSRRLCATINRDLTRDEWRQYLSGETYEPTCPR
ncbi:nSTAND1 domain-containing NTPase [Actinoplanes sp. HUAS TT8]|uniref:nSTAND1 domain-containing NTPase n=1 Tax=Actinoplanes sp. HUAS TT8 TaxID=3447453 RepID=UPI003F5262C6